MYVCPCMYEGHSTNKLQNGIVLSIFIWKIHNRPIHCVWNLTGDTNSNFYKHNFIIVTSDVLRTQPVGAVFCLPVYTMRRYASTVYAVAVSICLSITSWYCIKIVGWCRYHRIVTDSSFCVPLVKSDWGRCCRCCWWKYAIFDQYLAISQN